MNFESKDFKLAVEPHPQGIMRLLIVLVLIGLAFFLFLSAKNAFEKPDELKNTINVSKEAKRFVKPDIARASFSIRKEDASLKKAQDEVASLSNKVVEYLKGQGVEEKDMRTISYNIYPQEIDRTPPCLPGPLGDYRCPPRTTTKTFVVETTYDVKIRDLGKVSEIIAGTVRAGANQISSLQFVVDDPVMERLRKEAREEAIKKARDEAKTLAKNLDVRLGDLISFSEFGPPLPIYGRFALEGKGGDFAAAPPQPSIAPGESEIVSSVTLVYEIK